MLTIILNFPATIRFQLNHVLPLFVIPDANNAKDLFSFFEPILEELNIMTEEIQVNFWENVVRLLRVHIFSVGGDIYAITKLSSAKCQNRLSPCLLCNMNGYWVPSRFQMFFVIIYYSKAQPSLQIHGLVCCGMLTIFLLDGRTD